jgi:hypothetical protein
MFLFERLTLCKGAVNLRREVGGGVFVYSLIMDSLA